MNKAALLASALLATSCVVQREAPRLDGRDVRLTILHTSDIHSRLLPYDLQPMKSDRDLGLSPAAAPFGGIGRLAALLERERSRSERVVHLDSGDCFQGAPIFNENHGEAEVRWLSLMGADAVVVGNHEFDAGAWNFYLQAAEHATYPLLAANYDFRDPSEPGVVPLREVVRPYTIVNAEGLRIGVVGGANISSLNSIVAEGNSMGIVPLEQNESMRGWVEFLRPQVDLVVVVSHLGLHEDVDLVKGYERTFRHEDVRHLAEREADPWVLVEDLGDGRGRYQIPGVRGLDVIMGGHLHVVLDPPQRVLDPDGREVVIAHSGAFAKYLGRLDLVLTGDPGGPSHGYEVKAYDYRVFPVDAAWCAEERPDYDPVDVDGTYRRWVEAARAQCEGREHALTQRLLQPYLVGLNQSLDLPRIFGFAPRTVGRRNGSTGGDAPLGNLTAESMRRRKRVDAEIALTNTLGIRDAIYPGPINLETMFNVFPFENTITVMYLSGAEIQELLDFVTERSAGRGCQSQAQVAGLRFRMDCGQALANEHRYACEAPADCPRFDPSGEDGVAWDCRSGICWGHPARDITVNGEPLDPGYSYKVAVNDYIARGGSGFGILARNTTRFDTGISLRDGLIEYLENFCSCRELLAADAAGLATCRGTLLDPVGLAACSEIARKPAGAWAGKCTCAEVQEAVARGAHRDPACGHVTPAVEAFCEAPLEVPVVVGLEDGRIERRVIDRSL